MTAEAVDFAPPLRDRIRGRPPPLSAWLLAAGIITVVCALTATIFIFVATPVQTPSDVEFLRGQIARLDRQELALRHAGANPISIVFIGTSRIKNVAFNPAEVARAAKSAGIERPVVSTYMAINWGGFERFQPAIEMLKIDRPDVVVVMPELFVEDFNYRARFRLGHRFLQTKLWNEDYKLFGPREFNEPVCHGFDRTVQDRISDHHEWIMAGRDLPGPAAARKAVRDLAGRGILILIADVPVSRTMAAVHPQASGGRFAAQSGLTPSRHFETAWLEEPLPQDIYCDWAHIHPAHAHVWQRAFFAKAAPYLKRLPE